MQLWRKAVLGWSRGDLVLLGLTALLALLLSLRWWDLPRWPVPVVQAGFPLLGLTALAWTFVLLVARRLRVALAAAVVALVPALTAVPTLGSSAVAAQDDDEVVLVANLEFGAAESAAVIQRIKAVDASTVVLLEVTPSAADRLARAGLGDLLPHRVGAARAAAAGTVIHSRHRLTAVEAPSPSPGFDQPVARVHRSGQSYLLRGVHPYPPERGLTQRWRSHLADVERWADREPRDEPMVLAGDFNASHAHPGFRALLSDFADAHRASGQRWVRTWPTGRTVPPFIALNHVLVRGGETVDAGVQDLPDTDHRAVWARLRIG